MIQNRACMTSKSVQYLSKWLLDSCYSATPEMSVRRESGALKLAMRDICRPLRSNPCYAYWRSNGFNTDAAELKRRACKDVGDQRKVPHPSSGVVGSTETGVPTLAAEIPIAPCRHTHRSHVITLAILKFPLMGNWTILQS